MDYDDISLVKIRQCEEQVSRENDGPQENTVRRSGIIKMLHNFVSHVTAF